MEPDPKLLSDKLDLIIRLLAMPLVAGRRKSEAIIILSQKGMDRNLIATICETTPHTVSVVLSGARKKPPVTKSETKETDA